MCNEDPAAELRRGSRVDHHRPAGAHAFPHLRDRRVERLFQGDETLRQARLGPGGDGGRHGTVDADHWRLGELLQLAKGAGQIVEGWPPKVENKLADDNEFPRVTLKEGRHRRNGTLCSMRCRLPWQSLRRQRGIGRIKTRQGREQRPAYKQMSIFAKIKKLFSPHEWWDAGLIRLVSITGPRQDTPMPERPR
jgi:hypothetical protein